MDQSPSFYVTTPIYYVNDVPHIGHAYTSLACDVLARFMRLDGYRVHFLTGTDEHGQKIEKSASLAGVTPQAFADRVSHNFRELARIMNFSHDDFIRTTEPRHIAATQALWTRLVERGHIYLDNYVGWYSVRDETFFAQDDLVDGKAPTGADVEWVEEPSYFFDLSKWQDKLLAHYAAHPEFIGPDSRRNEVISFVKSGLRDLSISRTSFQWGVPAPGLAAGDMPHVVYVWLDALTNYITALGYPDETQGKWQEFWPADIHMVGKDIVRFHAVYWPAFLMAAGLPVPKRVFAHGWWTHEGQKISKSLGNAIDPLALVATYGLDATRYFLMREVSFGQDGDFSHAQMIKRINTDLANDLGNLVQRVLSLINKNCAGLMPQAATLLPADEALLLAARSLHTTLRRHFKEQAFHKALEAIWEVVSQSNRYIDDQAPWTLRREDPARMATVLSVLAEVLRLLAILVQPFMPDSAARILDQLAVPAGARDFTKLADVSCQVAPGTPLPAPVGVFPRFIPPN